MDLQSHTVYTDYINNILEKSGLQYAENQRITAVRKVYQKALGTPMHNLDIIWGDYCTYEKSLAETSDNLMSSLCQCSSLSRTGQFGMEITLTSLESLTEVVLHFGVPNNEQRCTQSLTFLFRQMVPTCLANTCENSIYAESYSALYSIIAFERFFDEYVNELFSKKSNEAARNVLESAFRELMEVAPEAGNRRGRVQFRNRMEKFLNKIQGLLSYN